MNRDTLLRSHLFFNRNLLQALLLPSLVLIASPAWSAPIERLSHSAIDLSEVREQSNGVSGVEAPVTSSQQPVLISVETLNSQSSPTKLECLELQCSNHSPLCTAQDTLPSQHPTSNPKPSIDLDPKLIESSPVLQRWLKQVPDVLADIKRDPSFRTRLRLGYTQFPSSKDASGLNVGLEDIFVGRSGLTFSADYQTDFNQRTAWGGNVRYYIRPLGSVINVAPVLGYRHLETTRYNTEGLQVGLRLLLVPSRTGAADLAVTQSWVTPRGENEVGLTTLSFGYALTRSLRLSTDLEKQNSRFRSDSRVSVNLEWMF
ncbi:MAG: hypothetical protein ACAF41_24025 [Leptolyngbya sp. BL-A-14]